VAPTAAHYSPGAAADGGGAALAAAALSGSGLLSNPRNLVEPIQAEQCTARAPGLEDRGTQIVAESPGTEDGAQQRVDQNV
jgi:hypothetical protein